MKKYLTQSEALSELNKSKLIKSDTADGYISIKKKSSTIYEVKVFTKGENEPVVMNGSIKSVLKTFNDSKINDGFYIE